MVRGKLEGKPVYQYDNGLIYSAEDGIKVGEGYVGDLEWTPREIWVIWVVCTVTHLDHNPANCQEENLRFWCQRCHNQYDRKHRDQTIRNRRLKNQLKLFQ
jgi:hypothetical protein